MLQEMRASAKYIWIIIVILFVGGFLLAQTSGLLGRAPVTSTTAVATVNGEDILATTWYQATQTLEQQETQRSNHTLTLDEHEQLASQAFDELVTQVLLRQEYERRGIVATDEEITEAARSNPPQQLMQNPDFQTEGRFDEQKYQRFLSSSAARSEGFLLQLEQYYRTQIPREKLFDQVASDIYVSDDQLWQRWRDGHDTARVSLVEFTPDRVPDSAVSISDDEIRSYYDSHKKDYDRPGRASVSILQIPRAVTAADTARVRARALLLRSRILGGEKFADVARTESADSGSAANGGSLGKGARGRFVKAFEDAAYALKPGEISQPVLTQFGFHVIKLDARKGDTTTVSHILLRIEASDSEATVTDRKADSLSKLAASSDQPRKFDDAARILNLSVLHAIAIEGNPVTVNGRGIPSVGPWAFQGVKPGETSDLFDTDQGYYLARLDSLFPGGTAPLNRVKAEIRDALMKQKKLDKVLGQARNFAKLAAAGSLEDAARLTKLPLIKTNRFTRLALAPELAALPEVAGAAFTLPVGAVSDPIPGTTAVAVARVDWRMLSDSAAWASQKDAQRKKLVQDEQQQRVKEFLDNLRQVARITDRRKQIEAATRRSSQ